MSGDIQKLRLAFERLLATEIQLYGGIPHKPPYEVEFRHAVAEFLGPPEIEVIEDETARGQEEFPFDPPYRIDKDANSS